MDVPMDWEMDIPYSCIYAYIYACVNSLYAFMYLCQHAAMKETKNRASEKFT